MAINKVQIKNFLGIKELTMHPGKVNLIQGRNGQCKSSILEALEVGFTNNSRRPRIIRDGEDQALILIETDDLNIRRSITPAGGSLNVKNKDGFKAPSPQKMLTAALGMYAFSPVDFLTKGEKEQTQNLLSVAPITITPEDVLAWTGEKPPVDYSQHGLKVCKDLHDMYYDKRKDVNAEVKAAKTDVEGIRLPEGFTPEKYRNVSLRDLYGEVEKARLNNTAIQEAEQLIKDVDIKLAHIAEKTDAERERIKANTQADLKEAENRVELQIVEARSKADDLKHSLNVKIAELEAALVTAKDKLAGIDTQLQNLEQAIQESKQASIQAIMTAEVTAVAKLKEQYDKAICETTVSKVAAEQVLAEASPIDLAPLENRVKEHEEMKGYVREYDRKVEAEARLTERKAEAKRLDDVVKLLAAKPGELIKQANLPVEGLGIDERGYVTINGLPIKNLSKGEAMKLTLDIARATSGNYKIIFVDNFESLDKENQAELLKQADGDGFQWFIFVVGDGDLKVSVA